MNTIVFSKLSGQVLFEEDAKERERGGRPYVGVVEGPHHAEVLLPDSPSIKESLSLRNRRTGYAPRSAPARVGVAGEGGGFGRAPFAPATTFPGLPRWQIPPMGDAETPELPERSVRRRDRLPRLGHNQSGAIRGPFARAPRVRKPQNGAARRTAAAERCL